MPTLVRSASLINFAEVATSVGLDAPGLLREFGLPARSMADLELKVPLDAVRRLLEASAERSGCEAFGLRMAESRRLSHLGPLGLLIREQPTLRRALDEFVHHGHQMNEALFLAVEEVGQLVVLREELVAGNTGPIRQSTELALGVAYQTMSAFLGPAWRPRSVCFSHDAPRDRSTHIRLFGSNVEFGHDFNGIVCARSDLDVANPAADPEVERMARQLLDAEPIAQDAGRMTSQVRGLIVKLLGAGGCTIERIAQHLGVDPRTVQRHLRDDGTTFSQVVDSVRDELADRYLKDRRRSLAEVSTLLGFAAPSGFSRWYRHRFGRAPSHQRPASAVR